MVREVYTPPQLAEAWQLKPATVLGWIRAGELAAFNVAKPGTTRPRFRITRQAAEEFQRRRAAVKPKPPRRQAPRQSKRPGFVDFFPGD